jgi:hypothetical protein
MQLRKLVALQESSNQGPTAESGRGQFVGTGPGGSTVGDPGQAQRKQMMQAQLMEFSPNGLKQLQGALKGALGADKPTDHLAQARKWGWIKKILGWAGLLSTIYFIWANWDNLKAFFQNLWPNLKKGWNYMRDKATEYWKKYWPAVKKGFNDAWAAVVGFVTPLWNDTIWPGLKAAWDWVVDTITPWAEEAWALIQQGWDWVVKTITPWAEEAWALILAGWDWVVKKFTAWWNDNIQPFIEKIGTIINTYWEATKEFVSTWFATNVWLNVLRGWEWMKAAGVGVVMGILAEFSLLKSWAFQKLKVMLLKAFFGLIELIHDVSWQVVSSFKIAIYGALMAIPTALLGILDNIIEWLPDWMVPDSVADSVAEAHKGFREARTVGIEEEEKRHVARLVKSREFFEGQIEDDVKKLKKMQNDLTSIKPVKDAIKSHTDAAAKAFDLQHKDQIEKGKKAGDRFREATEGVTDILFENGKNMKEASNNTKEAALAMRTFTDDAADFHHTMVTLHGADWRTDAPGSAAHYDAEKAKQSKETLAQIEEMEKRQLAHADDFFDDLDKKGVQTGILNRIANSIENMRPSTPFIGPMPAPAGSSPSTPSQVFTNRQLAT